MTRSVVVVEDDPALREWVRLVLEDKGLEVRGCASAETGLEAIRERNASAAIVDLGLPGMSGLDLLRALVEEELTIPVVVMTAEDSVDIAVECMRLGARDYVQKPIQELRFLTSVVNACERGELDLRVARLAADERSAHGLAAVVGDSPTWRAVCGELRTAAASDATVLLTGETGTGKEVAARALHAESERAHGPFVAVNCGALPEALVESELFGHERGAFTGAESTREGLFERGNRGTVFLDEIGELSMPMQVKLLRVLQEREVRRVGGTQDLPIDVRIVAATNRRPEEAIREGRLRSDLYYRLNVFPIHLPPLRERGGDVVLLAEHFLRAFAARRGRAVPRLGEEAHAALLDAAWPGNVRELENAMERAMLLSPGDEIEASALRPSGSSPEAPRSRRGELDAGGDGDDILPLSEQEHRAIQRAIARTDGNVAEAARLLGISRATLYRKLAAQEDGKA